MNSPRIQDSGELKFNLLPTRPVTSLRTHVLLFVSTALHIPSLIRSLFGPLLPSGPNNEHTRNEERTGLGASLSAI